MRKKYDIHGWPCVHCNGKYRKNKKRNQVKCSKCGDTKYRRQVLDFHDGYNISGGRTC